MSRDLLGAAVSREAFLEAIFPVMSSGTFVEVRAIHNGAVRRLWCDNLSEVAAAADSLSEEFDVYFGPAARKRHGGTRDDVLYVAVYWVDLDCPVTEAMERLAAFPLAPSAVVASGRGVHIYWLLTGASPVYRAAYHERRLKGLAQHLGGDSAWDISRILRVPGTVNHKNGAAVEVIEFHSERRYDQREFKEWETDITEASPVEFGDDNLDAEAVLSHVRGRLSTRSLTLIEQGHSDGSDRSKADYGVICDLVRLRLTDDEIRAVFARYPVGEKYRERGEGNRYLGRTVGKARQEQENLAALAEGILSGTHSATLPEEVPFPEICLRGTFRDYVSLWEEHEGAEVFDFVACLAAYGIAIGRRAYVVYGRNVYPNIWAVLYGPTNVSKKSTAISRGVDLALEVDPGVQRLGALLSPEGLLQALGHKAGDPSRSRQRAVLELEEFRALLAKARQDSVGGLIPLLVQLWDCRPAYRLATRTNPIVAEEPTLSILAASTSEWLEAALTDSDIWGGFCNRFLYVTGALRPLVPLPPEPDAGRLQAVVQAFNDALQSLDDDAVSLGGSVKITLSDGAKAVWVAYYTQFNERRRPTEAVASAIERVPVYVLKLAMLYAVDRRETVISADDMEAAAAFGEYTAHCASRLFIDIAGSRVKKLEAAILRGLGSAGGLPRWKLQQKVGGRHSAEELNRTVNALIAVGLVEQRGNALTLTDLDSQNVKGGNA